MESEFLHDNENFEQFLKDSTQDFKMYPSRKVWYSLYNNLHPGSKWPSLAVCLILISTILFIDISNNNKISKLNSSFGMQTTEDGKERIEKGTTGSLFVANGPIELSPESNALFQIKDEAATEQKRPTLAGVHHMQAKTTIAPSDNENSFTDYTELNTSEKYTALPQISMAQTENIDAKNISVGIHETTGFISEEQKPVHVFQPPVKDSETALASNSTVAVIPVENSSDHSLREISIPVESASTTSDLNTELLATQNRLEEAIWQQSWIDDYAFYNKPKTSKWKERATMQFYVTPSLGYRAMYKNNDYEAATLSLIALNPDEDEEEVNQNAAYNMEFGFAINYELNKKWRAKAGLQFNHTNYIVNAGQLFHPSQTTMILSDLNTGLPVIESHTSYYSNRSTANNETRLTNSTIQFSMPIGIDYSLMEHKKLNWRLGLTVQPTYIANGEAYLISSDTKNYISMPSLMRKWNANASIESVVSYKTNAGFTIDFGPQFRYQLQSTYTKQYGYSEKLYNIGLKLGITRGF